MIGKSGMRNLDGTSEIKIVGKKKKYRIEIKKSVLKVKFVCWKIAIIAHEFCHTLTYAEDRFDTKSKLDQLADHGTEFQETVRNYVRFPVIQVEVMKEVSPRPACVYKFKKQRCPWCKKNNGR